MRDDEDVQHREFRQFAKPGLPAGKRGGDGRVVIEICRHQREFAQREDDAEAEQQQAEAEGFVGKQRANAGEDGEGVFHQHQFFHRHHRQGDAGDEGRHARQDERQQDEAPAAVFHAVHALSSSGAVCAAPSRRYW